MFQEQSSERKNSAVRHTLNRSIKQLDLFSQRLPNFNINGEESISSGAGALLSLAIICIMITFGSHKF